MDRISEIIEASWRGETLEALKAFVRLPAKNRVFDPDWEKNGWLVRAVEDAARWGRQRFPKGRFEILYRPGLTPVLVFDLPAEGGHTGRPAFFYGHFDKQPETEGWAEGLGPWEPVVRDGRLYGRGTSDDGYSYYAALTARRSIGRASPVPAWSVSTKPMKKAARRALPNTCRTRRPLWATPRSSAFSTSAFGTTNASGSRSRCAGW